MTDDQVKTRLRNAVSEGVIWGWYRHLPLKGKEWVVNPLSGPCISYTPAGIRDFCDLLACTGLTHEPTEPSPDTGTTGSTSS